MTKIAVGITGQSGFIGTHLTNFLRIKKDEIEIIPFSRDYFENNEKLSRFVSKCDVVVHLAAMNRGDPETLFKSNVSLVKQLIASLEDTQKKTHIIFSSSVQEKRDNSYGRSKWEGRMILEEWAQRNQAKLTCLIIPNVFGPFGKPFYNSVVSTFSYQLTHKLQPKIEIDADLSLIYVHSLVKTIFEVIIKTPSDPVITIEPEATMKVTEILSKLQEYQQLYFEKHIFPQFKNDLEISLFNTFRSYIESDYFPILLESHTDKRGYLMELVKELSGGQVFFSVTKPEVTRGNHFHLRKIERFCVIKGDALIRLRKIGFDTIIQYELTGTNPGFVDIPVWYTHSITNIGRNDLITIFWTNELFDERDSDTYYDDV